MNKTSTLTKKRIILVFVVMIILICALCVRLGYVQIVKGEEYAKMAVAQQTRDELIVAKRGDILDRNGEELAISASCYTLWARPANVQKGSSDAEKKVSLQAAATSLSGILGISEEELKETLSSEKRLIKVAKYLDRQTVDAIKAQKVPGLEFSEDVKRNYPLGNFASHVLGSVTDDNKGLAGIELKYNQYLSGVAGRWIKNTDVGGNDLSYGVNDYYAAEDGLNVVLTLDTVIQHYVEKAINTTQEDTKADRVMCIVMDPKTGDVLAMAVTPDFDPNNPRVPLDEEEAAYLQTLPPDEQVAYWNKMWRNPMVSDTYEPGSTFKLITTSIALEEEVTYPKENFYCSGSYKVAGVTLHCWRTGNPHGAETLTEAVGNSCNPIFIQLAQRVGEDKYYDYLERYGLYEKTGIDFPGEGLAILQNKATAGPVGLATMSYGQGIAVTPIQLITAVCTIGNGGKLMQPRMVKALTDKEGNVVKEFDTTVVRQVVSKETADEMKLIMEHVVAEGGAGKAKIPGYRIGGKTGTANKAIAGGYSDETYSSFIGMAPMEDPQVVVLMIVDNPKGVKYGSQTAAPGAKLVLEDTLRYLNIEPNYSDSEKQAINTGMVVVPNVKGEAFSEAIGILGGALLTYEVSPAEAESGADFTITSQYPKAGETVKRGTKIYLYK